MKVLLTGAEGLLGTALVEEACGRGYDVVPLGRSELDVTDGGECNQAIRRAHPEIVVHCAAYTAVDLAESEPVLARMVNEDGTRNVVAASLRAGARLVYPSTDYVFGGAGLGRPWRPDDHPEPRGVYARTKYAGEEVVRAASDRNLVLRTGWLYGKGGRNFVDTVVGLVQERGLIRVVSDQVGRPTWTTSLARTLFDLIEAGAEGTYHATDGGTATWFDLARAAVESAGVDARVEPVTTGQFGAVAPRPTYSVLDLESTEGLLRRPAPDWRKSLVEYLTRAAPVPSEQMTGGRR
jgi:dTDP-4-dehydrorhamnose reductase